MHDYANQLYNILKSIKTSPSFHQQFDRFMTTSLSKIIADAEVEKILHEHKKEM